jgi:hypothetical protein
MELWDERDIPSRSDSTCSKGINVAPGCGNLGTARVCQSQMGDRIQFSSGLNVVVWVHERLEYKYNG